MSTSDTTPSKDDDTDADADALFNSCNASSSNSPHMAERIANVDNDTKRRHVITNDHRIKPNCTEQAGTSAAPDRPNKKADCERPGKGSFMYCQNTYGGTLVGHHDAVSPHVSISRQDFRVAQQEDLEQIMRSGNSSATNVEDDDLFDSDEQVDVESLSSSDDESLPLPRSHSHTPMPAPIPVNQDLDAAKQKLKCASSQESHGMASTLRAGPSLLSRASQTFYKTFIKRKTSSERHTSSACKRVESACESPESVSLGDSTRPQDAVANDQNERICRLLDAQLSALAGAKTGFVQLALLRPLAEETLRAVSIDARALLSEFGEFEHQAERIQREASDARSRGDEEVVRKERLLIEAKVALAEACGEVERLRGELASVRRALSEPGRRQKGVRKRADEMKRETSAFHEARTGVENKILDRNRSLEREKADLCRMEKEYRDIEGDWA